jgi:amphi-Trp domain-containing protein
VRSVSTPLNRLRVPAEHPGHHDHYGGRHGPDGSHRKERLSREAAAERLHAMADALARNNEVEFERGGLRFKVHMTDEIDFKLEIEIGDQERELEIELKW